MFPFWPPILFGCVHGSHLYQREIVFIKVRISSTSASDPVAKPLYAAGFSGWRPPRLWSRNSAELDFGGPRHVGAAGRSQPSGAEA